MQILHYEHGEKYEPHFDYFHDKANQELGGHRVATVLMYLSNVENGGETIFPNAEVMPDDELLAVLKFMLFISNSFSSYINTFLFFFCCVCSKKCLNEKVLIGQIVLKVAMQVRVCDVFKSTVILLYIC